MGGVGPGSAREEAERLVATVLGAARLAAATSGAGGWGPLGEMVSGVLGHTDRPAGAGAGGFATGSPECCVCPVCRGIAALRDPSPEFAERLATGAGDLAAGVASLLRAFASAGTGTTGDPGTSPAGPPTGAGPDTPGHRPAASTGPDTAPAAGSAPSGADADVVWREATRTRHDSQPAPEPEVWAAATRGAGATAPAGTGAGTAGRNDRAETRSPVVPAAREPGAVPDDRSGDEA
ncbi:hypothetical protein [Micromonospora echinofusca]|uniref:Uncharacterized protein n=1 Tax=Micromonospora echinofusca TaxID=47858 RepID=A0ABS3VZY6_MICEH|nr:hypothetical protein [Micromonospora echinofusca]MBO4210100.1 hypothetical protein [Micromonospora echinofusca]